MKKISVEEFKRRSNHFLASINNEGLILNNNGVEFVILMQSEYNSMIETIYLNSSLANTRRLLSDIDASRSSKIVSVEKSKKKL